jgi:hypothetical protein
MSKNIFVLLLLNIAIEVFFVKLDSYFQQVFIQKVLFKLETSHPRFRHPRIPHPIFHSKILLTSQLLVQMCVRVEVRKRFHNFFHFPLCLYVVSRYLSMYKFYLYNILHFYLYTSFFFSFFFFFFSLFFFLFF